MKKLLLVILSLSILGQFDMTSAMKREFNQEAEKANKMIKIDKNQNEMLIEASQDDAEQASNIIEKLLHNITDLDKETACIAIMNTIARNYTESLKILLNNKTVLELIDEETAIIAVDEALVAHNSVTLEMLFNCKTITDFIEKNKADALNISRVINIFNSCNYNHQKKIAQILLSNNSVLYQLTQYDKDADILKLLRISTIYSINLITPDIASNIITFVLKKKFSGVLEELLKNKNFMNCIDAQGAQAALDEAPLYEMYELLKQNKQIRKLLKLDYSCLVQ